MDRENLRNVYDFLTEIVLNKEKQLDDLCTSNQAIILGLIVFKRLKDLETKS